MLFRLCNVHDLFVNILRFSLCLLSDICVKFVFIEFPGLSHLPLQAQSLQPFRKDLKKKFPIFFKIKKNTSSFDVTHFYLWKYKTKAR